MGTERNFIGESEAPKNFAIHCSELTMMRVANGIDAESPSVRQSKAFVGGRGGTQETKWAHDVLAESRTDSISTEP
jgi:hypothetical protein